MTRDNEIPAIYNPRRVRAPSVVVTDDSPVGSIAEGNLTNILVASNPQILCSDSANQPDGFGGSGGGGLQPTPINATANTTTTSNVTPIITTESNNSNIGTNNNINIHLPINTVATATTTNTLTATTVISTEPNNNNSNINNVNTNSTNNNMVTPANGGNTTKYGKCKESCCSELAQKVIIKN